MGFSHLLMSSHQNIAYLTPTSFIFSWEILSNSSFTSPIGPTKPWLTSPWLWILTNERASQLFTGLWARTIQVSPPKPKTPGNRILEQTYLNGEWDCILELVHSSSICARHRLIQCKILHRIHYTNVRPKYILMSVMPAICTSNPLLTSFICSGLVPR